MSNRRRPEPNPFSELLDLGEERENWESAYDQRELEAVKEARKAGLTWEEIADSLGRTRSSVWKKYHGRVDLRA